MKEYEIIKAIAELDGWVDLAFQGNYPDGEPQFSGYHAGYSSVFIPHYLCSRDAITPVIERQIFNKKNGRFLSFLSHAINPSDEPPFPTPLEMIVASPWQLCEALLRATGKWKENL